MTGVFCREETAWRLRRIDKDYEPLRELTVPFMTLEYSFWRGKQAARNGGVMLEHSHDMTLDTLPSGCPEAHC